MTSQIGNAKGVDVLQCRVYAGDFTRTPVAAFASYADAAKYANDAAIASGLDHILEAHGEALRFEALKEAA